MFANACHSATQWRTIAVHSQVFLQHRMVERLPGNKLCLFILFSCAQVTHSGSFNLSIEPSCYPREVLNDVIDWFFVRPGSRALLVYSTPPVTGPSPLHDDDVHVHLIREISSRCHVPLVHRALRGNETHLEWTVGNQKTGVLVIGDSFETIKGLFAGLNRDVNNNQNGDFMFVIVAGNRTAGLLTDTHSKPDARVMGPFFGGLWRDFNILNSLVVVVCCCGGVIRDLDVGFYDPFASVGGFEPDNQQSWGKFEWTTEDALQEEQRKFITKRYVDDFRGYPIKLNQFKRYPTAIERKHIPIAVQQSYIYSQCRGNGKSV